MHIHSHFSDGDCSVEELVKRIKRAGLKAAVLTDHDKIDGQELFLKLCKQKNIAAVAGIEISTTYRQPGVSDAELHILGYDFGLNKIKADKKILAYNIQSRQRQIAGLISQYKKRKTFFTSAEKIGKIFGLPHPVINHYWVTRIRAIDMLKKSKKHLSFFEARKIAAKEIKKYGPFHFGLDGLEGFTERNSGAETKWLIKLCQKHGLNPYFGGTDYHGHKITEHKPGRYLGKGGIKYKEFAKNFEQKNPLKR